MLFQRRPPTESAYAVNELILDQAPGGTLFRSKNSPRDTDSNESGLGKIVSERDAASLTSRNGESGEPPGTCFYPPSFYLKRRLLVKTQTKSAVGYQRGGVGNAPESLEHFCGAGCRAGSLTNRSVVKSVR